MDNLSQSPYQQATFAGGCFWCIESAFIDLPGVISVTSGFAGGHTKNPDYNQIHAEDTGHREAVRVVYDQNKLPYTKLLEIFWQNIDPADAGGQFADRGFEYTTAIFYHNDKQQKLAQDSKDKLENSDKFNKPIATQILPNTNFYPAEDAHQQYAKKHPERYSLYKKASGRQDYLENTWKNT